MSRESEFSFFSRFRRTMWSGESGELGGVCRTSGEGAGSTTPVPGEEDIAGAAEEKGAEDGRKAREGRRWRASVWRRAGGMVGDDVFWTLLLD